ncbi:MAG: PBSX family phage terminase large subunit [Clostridia bacterium]|nr:PBSX family phage terminase large subunit [Clostridia bacterium]
MTEFRFGEKHRAYMRRAMECVMNVAEGAVRAGKTVDNVFVFAACLDKSPDRIHLATGATIANAKLNLGDCNGMGLERIFRGRCRWGRYRDNECLYVGTPLGERVVIFAGGRNADAYKRIRGNSYGMWIATEINHHHDSFIREAFNRQLAARNRKVFWDLNPSAPGSSIYREYLDRYAADPGERFYNYAHFTIRDNPVITAERLAEIVAQYDPDSVWYRRDILGQRCAAEGLIYRVFAEDRSRFTLPAEDIPPLRYINIGVDFGGNRSKTTFVAVGFPAAGGIAALADHAIAGDKGEIDPARIHREFAAFCREVRALWPGTMLKYAFCDSEAQYLINGLRRFTAGEEIRICECAKRPILDRITFVLGLMNSGRFHLTERCSRLAEGLAQAVWVEGEDRRKDDFTSDIDVLDAFEYAVERYMGKV